LLLLLQADEARLVVQQPTSDQGQQGSHKQLDLQLQPAAAAAADSGAAPLATPAAAVAAAAVADQLPGLQHPHQLQ
jgi:hypothetical protein